MYSDNRACERCIEEGGRGEYKDCVYNNKDCHDFVMLHSHRSCEICGCIFSGEECPLCKLRDEIPAILEDLEDKIKERGIYSPDY